MQVTFYRLATGEITRTFTFSEADAEEMIALNIDPGEAVLPGHFDAETCFVVGGEVLDRPPRPAPHLEWTGSDWIDPRTDEELEAAREGHWAALRAERDRLLAASDWTQMPTARLTEAQRAAWNDYRDALFDLPDTTEDPAAPAWPSPPS